MKTLVFTATYNERPNIAAWLTGVRASVPDGHILVVDDDSPDGTASVIEEFSGRDLSTTLVRRPGKSGLASAHLLAFSIFLQGDYDSLVTMDADGSHLPHQIPTVLEGLAAADFAIGTRTRGGSHRASPSRRLLSRGANATARLAIPTGLSEYTTSFRAFTPKAAQAVIAADLRDSGYAFFIECVECLYRRGISMTERPIDFLDRAEGKSKIPRNQILVSMGVLARLGFERRWRALGSDSLD